MTLEEFKKKWHENISPFTDMRLVCADLDAVFDRARAEARRDALLEAIRCADPYTHHYTQIGEAIDSLPRWDGHTPFVPEKVLP